MKSKFSIAICTLMLWGMSVSGQSVHEIDVTISRFLEHINRIYSADKSDAEESDTLRKENKKLVEYMKVAATHPELMHTGLPAAEASGLLYATSDDNALRIYAWDTWTGSSMHYFNVIAQYKVDNSTRWSVINEIPMTTNELHDPGAYVTDMTTIHTKDGKIVYLAVDCTIASARDKATRVQAYTIENGTLVTIPFFRPDKELTKAIDFVYNYTPDSTSPEIFAIRLNTDKDKLYVPYVQPNGKLSSEKITYDFDGYEFVLSKKERKKMGRGQE